MVKDIEKLAYDWAAAEVVVDLDSDYYCKTVDVFQARLSKMLNDLLKNSSIAENKIYTIVAIAGEIGNNSFDHNIGSWPDTVGIFFSYGFVKDKFRIVLADRGQGVLKTLKKVKPELEDDFGAVKVAFTERISARAPEARGNGLKFSKESVEKENMHLVFISGSAQADLNEKMEIKTAERNVNGCLAILS